MSRIALLLMCVAIACSPPKKQEAAEKKQDSVAVAQPDTTVSQPRENVSRPQENVPPRRDNNPAKNLASISKLPKLKLPYSFNNILEEGTVVSESDELFDDLTGENITPATKRILGVIADSECYYVLWTGRASPEINFWRAYINAFSREGKSLMSTELDASRDANEQGDPMNKIHDTEINEFFECNSIVGAENDHDHVVVRRIKIHPTFLDPILAMHGKANRIWNSSITSSTKTSNATS